MSNKKFKSVEVKTPAGPRILQFRFGENSSKDSSSPLNTCEYDCVYQKVCKLLPDPENPDDFAHLRFCDFCTRIGDTADTEEGRELRKYVPVPGEIENQLGDIFPRILEIVQEKNPIVYLSDVIDCVCEFQCDMYDAEHSQCGAGNSMCLLQDLFMKKVCSPGQPVVIKKLETDRPTDGKSEKA